VIAILTGHDAGDRRPVRRVRDERGPDHAEELRLIVERGGEQGVLEAEEEQMINAVIELGDRRLHEVMVPRIAIVALPASATLEEAIDSVVDEGHTGSRSTRSRSTRSSGSSTPRTCCRS
jgi:CBS domain containing-hemolysin-like protein